MQISLASAQSPVSPQHLESMMLRGEFHQVVTVTCEALADETLDRHERAELALHCARAAIQLDMLDLAAELLESAFDDLDPGASDMLAAQLRLENGRIAALRSQFEQAWHICRDVQAEAERAGWHSVAALSRVYCALAHRKRKEYVQCLTELNNALAYFEACPLEWGDLQARRLEVWALIGCGQIERSLERGEELLELLKQRGLEHLSDGMLLNSRCYAYWCMGNMRQLRPLQQELLAYQAENNPNPPRARLTYNLGLASLMVGDYGYARETLLRAWECVRQEGKEDVLPPLLSSLALTELHHHHLSQALEYIRLAASRVTVYGMTDSMALSWHLPLVLLAAGEYREAVQCWERRQPLPLPDAERWLELQLYRAALEEVGRESFPTPAPGKPAALHFAREWLAEVVAEQAQLPTPVAIDGGQVAGGLGPLQQEPVLGRI
jgi:tetratricopeptide (TPR) repeat protein